MKREIKIDTVDFSHAGESYYVLYADGFIVLSGEVYDDSIIEWIHGFIYCAKKYMDVKHNEWYLLEEYKDEYKDEWIPDFFDELNGHIERLAECE